MKKLRLLSVIIAGVMAMAMLGACSTSEKSTVIRVGAPPVPHEELLEFVKPKMAEKGYELEIVSPTDITSLLEQTSNGELTANFIGHKPAIDSSNAELKIDLQYVGPIHVEPMGFYSAAYDTVAQLPENATIAIPNDATNEYRALKLLEDNGFIVLKDNIDVVNATINDIVTYNKPIKIEELEAVLIIRSNDQFDAFITNTNNVLEYGFPKAPLFRESADSPYANMLVTNTKNLTNPGILALYDLLRSDEVKQFIEEKYNGAVIPAK